jgi:hypothetical protein
MQNRGANKRFAFRMRLAVEMLVDRLVQDSWGAQAELKYTRLRYELEIERRADERGLERLYITHESLAPIYFSHDSWLRRHAGNMKETWQKPIKKKRSTPFISTEARGNSSRIVLYLDDGEGPKSTRAERTQRTLLSSVDYTGFRHAFAAREEMRSWKFLQLNPETLRQPSSMLAHPFIMPDGSNLPACDNQARTTA